MMPATDPPPAVPGRGVRALVTGASRGLGLALAGELLTHRNGTVVLGLRDPRTAPAAAELAAMHPGRAWTRRVDYTDPSSLRHAGDQLELDRLDLLVNCGGANVAAGQPPTGSKGPLAELSYPALRALFEVNVAGPVLLCQAVLPALVTAGGLVANLSTGRASLAGADRPGSFGYAVSKAALNMATRMLAAELGPRGVSVVAVDPGWVRTRMGGPDAPQDPADTARRLLDTLLAPTRRLNGRLVDADGRDVPW